MYYPSCLYTLEHGKQIYMYVWRAGLYNSEELCASLLEGDWESSTLYNLELFVQSWYKKELILGITCSQPMPHAKVWIIAKRKVKN